MCSTKGQTAIAVGLIIGTLTLGMARTATAEVLEGDVVAASETACGELLHRFLDDHPGRHHDHTQAAIVGLDRADAEDILVGIRAELAVRCR